MSLSSKLVSNSSFGYFNGITRRVQQQWRKFSTTSSSSNVTEEVAFVKEGGIGIATLLRPKALNALTLPMVQSLTRQYNSWEADPSINAVVLKSGDTRAFCAGGDVRAIHEAGKSNLPLRTEFFIQEYQLNHKIHTLRKPHIALIDGITMGGGAGVSVHGDFIVATENTKFAMPEVSIGFTPDVGGSHFLSRLRGGIGTYLAMTGDTIVGHDVKAAGIATHFVPSKHMSSVIDALTSMQNPSMAKINEILHTFEAKHDSTMDGKLVQNLDLIEKCFSNKLSVPAIISSLKSSKGEFAQKALQTLSTVSPLAVHIAFELVKRGTALSLPECLQMEYTVVQRSLAGTEFYEGVRAALIDKDKSPKWDPPTLQEVDLLKVLQHFEPVPGLNPIPFDTTRVKKGTQEKK